MCIELSGYVYFFMQENLSRATMEDETVLVMELDTNTSNKTCSEGGKAWIFVVSFATI